MCIKLYYCYRSPPRKSSRTKRYLNEKDEDDDEDDDEHNDLLNGYDYINGENSSNTNS